MPVYFPEPYQDELLYSLLARYHRHMASLSPKQTLDDLFGARSVIAGLDLQGHLKSLSAHLPPAWGMTAERLATEFTLLPYYQAFHSDELRERAQQAVTDGSISGLHLILGLAPANSRVKKLRFCPDCLREMKVKHGELYWRRSHQVPGVLLCLEHGCILQESSVPFSLENRHAFLAATSSNCSRMSPVAPVSLVKNMALRSFAKTCLDILQLPPLARDRNDWVAWYLLCLSLKGLASAAGRVNQKDVEEGLQRHFGEALRPLLAEAGASDLTWLSGLTRQRRRALHPVLHILFQEFLKHVEDDQPFGAGPWPCLNPLIPHQGELLIDKVGIHHNHGRLVGVFECGCGFAYTRNISDSGLIGRARTLRFGDAFDDRLRQLVSMRVGIREAARLLHVDTGTVRLRASKLGLDAAWKPKPLSVFVVPDPVPYREAWCTLIRDHAGARRKKLSSLAPALYIWLYRHDREWLKAHQPSVQRLCSKVRHDWKRLDEQWALRVVELAEAIRRELPPRKVTLAEISRRTSEPIWLPNHLVKLPRTRACLERIRDSVSDFQVRRISWAAQQLLASGLPLAEWRIRRKAGLGKNLAPEVAEALAAARLRVEQLS